MSVWKACADFIASHGAGAVVSIVAVQGSAPREVGAAMVVRADGAFFGTIGGGALEWRMLEKARSLLASDRRSQEIDQSLGPDLGQCCGGRVKVSIEVFRARDAALIAERQTQEHAHFTSLLLFGAGHVGRALVLALAPLPFHVRWIDNRDTAFPSHVPAHVTCELRQDIDTVLAEAADHSLVMIMTHDHARDLALVAAALRQGPRLPFVGLIGSESKRARFIKRLHASGLASEDIARLTCPVGLPVLQGKAPAVIAAGITVQLLIE